VVTVTSLADDGPILDPSFQPVDLPSQPPNPLCVANFAGALATIGFLAGGGAGALGLAAGPVAGATIPAGAYAGAALGAGVGGLAGSILCSVGTGGGGGGVVRREEKSIRIVSRAQRKRSRNYASSSNNLKARRIKPLSLSSSEMP
jgi:hypothetical protein